METQRRYLSWSLAIIAAISLIFAGMRGGLAAPGALKALSAFDLPEFIGDMSDAMLLAGFAILAGTCAILFAPQRVLVAYKIISNRRAKGVWVREVQPGMPFARLEQIDADAPMDTPDTPAPSPQRPLTSSASASAPTPVASMKRPA